MGAAGGWEAKPSRVLLRMAKVSPLGLGWMAKEVKP